MTPLSDEVTPANYDCIVIGVSAGGLEALSALIPSLPAGFPIPIIVTQHQAADADGYLARHLDGLSQLTVKEADDKEPIVEGTVYLAPPGYHLLVEDDKSLALSVDQLVNYSRPSIDVLFSSAADVYGSALIGVVLTGASSDGAAGLRRIKERGGLVVVQDPSTARSSLMPESAQAAAAVEHVFDLAVIGRLLTRLGVRASR